MNDTQNEQHTPSQFFMQRAIELAQDARARGDYAIGAVVVQNGQIIGESGNGVKIYSDPTMHAEVAAIRSACMNTGHRHIQGSVLYTTAETCPMCASAAVWACMTGIVSGSTIEDMAQYRQHNGSTSWSWRTIDIATQAILDAANPRLFHISSFMREECISLFHVD